MTEKLAGRVAIVTGGSKGIGEACAKALAKQGAALIINYAHDDSSAKVVVNDIKRSGGKALAVQADVSNFDDIEMLFSTTQKEFSKPDILICSAGVSMIQSLADADEATFDRAYNINVKGLLFLLRAAALHLNDNGRVITIASSTAVAPPLGTAIYASSKAAAIKMTEVAAMELGERGITANSILPGLTETPMIDKMPAEYKQAVAESSPFRRIGLPQDVSALAVFLAGDEAQWITGQSIVANGGAKR